MPPSRARASRPNQTSSPRSPSPQPAAADQTRELALAARDVCYFVCTYCHVLVQDKEGVHVRPFELWDYQARLLTALSRGGHYIIVKARQLGITTCLAPYALHAAMFSPHAEVLLLSKDETDSRAFLQRVIASYDGLPDWMKAACPKGDIWNTQQITFANGSSILSTTATERSGRSHTARLVIVDEAAYIADLKATYSGLRPTLSGGGGQLVLLSTTKGPGDYFHELWCAAERKTGDIRGVFFPWHARPDRDQAWYERETSNMDEIAIKREYPATAAEAFASSALLVYPHFDRMTHLERMDLVEQKDESGRSRRYVQTARHGRFRVVDIQAGQDWNTALPGCHLVVAQASDGTLLVLDGWYEEHLPVVSDDPDTRTWATTVKQLSRAYRTTRIHCDHNPDAILAFQRAGLPATRATKDVAMGIGLVGQALKPKEWTDGTTRPTLLISDRLTFLADELEQYRRKVSHSGVITDAVVKERDHGCDALRYCTVGMLKAKPKISMI